MSTYSELVNVWCVIVCGVILFYLFCGIMFKRSKQSSTVVVSKKKEKKKKSTEVVIISFHKVINNSQWFQGFFFFFEVVSRYFLNFVFGKVKILTGVIHF